mmetsp:Transcript_26751/g.68050  ORF Transcript_26751/g.68050 Transcript_26751/m.68050 type:complete len:333 (-) Transcript_26751:271-1269(-)
MQLQAGRRVVLWWAARTYGEAKAAIQSCASDSLSHGGDRRDSRNSVAARSWPGTHPNALVCPSSVKAHAKCRFRRWASSHFSRCLSRIWIVRNLRFDVWQLALGCSMVSTDAKAYAAFSFTDCADALENIGRQLGMRSPAATVSQVQSISSAPVLEARIPSEQSFTGSGTASRPDSNSSLASTASTTLQESSHAGMKTGPQSLIGSFSTRSYSPPRGTSAPPAPNPEWCVRRMPNAPGPEGKRPSMLVRQPFLGRQEAAHYQRRPGSKWTHPEPSSQESHESDRTDPVPGNAEGSGSDADTPQQLGHFDGLRIISRGEVGCLAKLGEDICDE